MKSLLRLVCLFLLIAAVPAEVLARGAGGGSFGGGSRSSSSSSSGRSSSFSSGRSSSSGSSSWGSGASKPSSGGGTSTSSSWGSSSRFSPSTSSSRSTGSPSTSSSTQRSAPSSSATDAALARKVGQGGSTFASRNDAVKDFQQKYASNYNSTFSSEPKALPSYIPSTTVVNGNSYPVYYDYGHGGYGYWAGNRWTAYDVMRDAVMLNALMGQRNYSYGGGPGYGYDYGSRPAYYSNHSSGGGFFAGLVVIIILVIGAVIVVKVIRSMAAGRRDPFQGGGSSRLNVATGAATPPARNLSTSPMDKSKSADWLAVRPNSIVTVSDAQGIQDSMKRGQGVRGIDYTVRTIARMKQLDGLSTHLLFTLHDEEQETYLLVKIVDDLIDLGLYFQVPSLEPGSRKDMVDRGALWLFQEPQNPNSFDPAELRFTTSIRQTVPKEGGGDEEVFYTIKAQGELQCEYHETPPRSGMADGLATVVEYRADQQVENPEFLILETGDRQGKSSYLQFFLGCPVKFSEIDVLPS